MRKIHSRKVSPTAHKDLLPRGAIGLYFACACLWASSSLASSYFWIDPPAGRARGGDTVRLHVSTTGSITKAKVLFGDTAAAVQKVDAANGLIVVETPVYDRTGNPFLAGSFRQKVRVVLANKTTIDQGPDFLYVPESTQGNDSGGKGEHAATAASRILSLQPSHGPAEGGDTASIVSSVLPGHRAHCADIEVLFGVARARIVGVDLDAGVVRVVVPPFARLPDRNVDAVEVALRCAGATLANGAFVYHWQAAPQNRRGDGLLAALIIGAALGLAVQLWWIIRRLGRMESRLAEHPPGASGDSAPLDSRMEAIRNLLDEHFRSADRLKESLALAATKFSELNARMSNLPQPPWEEPAPSSSAGVFFESGGRRSPQQAAPSDQSDDETASRWRSTRREMSTRSASIGSSEFGPSWLAEVWNKVDTDGGTTEQLIASLNAVWPGKVVAERSGTLVVVIARDEPSSWVLPPIHPLLHESTIQEFFEVCPSHDAGSGVLRPRLIRPASVPKGTDPHGFTAGQIGRGVIEV